MKIQKPTRRRIGSEAFRRIESQPPEELSL